jgi:tRNA threonylcarbamoyladenosine biosynthesis protein TsaE
VIEHQHAGGRLPLYHIDLYRLAALDDALLEELDEHLFGDGVAAVEWPALLPADVRDGATLLRFTVVDAATRHVRVTTPEARLRAAASRV